MIDTLMIGVEKRRKSLKIVEKPRNTAKTTFLKSVVVGGFQVAHYLLRLVGVSWKSTKTEFKLLFVSNEKREYVVKLLQFSAKSYFPSYSRNVPLYPRIFVISPTFASPSKPVILLEIYLTNYLYSPLQTIINFNKNKPPFLINTTFHPLTAVFYITIQYFPTVPRSILFAKRSILTTNLERTKSVSHSTPQ